MVVIRLYGVLAEIAQRSVNLEVSKFDEAMRALCANFPRLAHLIRDMRVSVLVNGRMMEMEDCLRPLKADTIDILPVVGGNGPAIFILGGSALIAGSTAIASLFTGTFLASAITAQSVAQFGLAMIIGGISQLLIKPPKLGSTSESTASYLFNGAVNVTQQGNIVPVGYGMLRVGSVTISANVQTWDIPVNGDGSTPAPADDPAPANPSDQYVIEPQGGA